MEPLHPWNVTPTEAVAWQKALQDQVLIMPLDDAPKTIAGCDISFNKYEETVYAGIVVLRLDTLEVVEKAGMVSKALFPYIPGLLTFREGPALLEAWEQLKVEPDVVMFDGHGIAHPRRMGIASHMGLWINRPSFGCGKSVLTGKFEEPAPERGNFTPLVQRGITLGVALRTKNKVSPVFISPGHLIDLPTAIDLTLRCDGGYRLPEPTRQAHLFVNELRKKYSDETEA